MHAYIAYAVYIYAVKVVCSCSYIAEVYALFSLKLEVNMIPIYTMHIHCDIMHIATIAKQIESATHCLLCIVVIYTFISTLFYGHINSR